jgi:hypothetical protein
VFISVGRCHFELKQKDLLQCSCSRVAVHDIPQPKPRRAQMNHLSCLNLHLLLPGLLPPLLLQCWCYARLHGITFS